LVLFTLGNSSDSPILRSQERGEPVADHGHADDLQPGLCRGGPLALSDKTGRRSLIIAGWIAYSLVYLGFAFRRLAGRSGAVRIVWRLLRAATDVAKAFMPIRAE
jgi:hypothetical protein